MSVPYYLEIFSRPGDGRKDILVAAINNELVRLGAHRALSINVSNFPPDDQPAIGIYFDGAASSGDSQVEERLAKSLAAGRAVIPVVNDLASYLSRVPECLRPINGFAWSGEDPEARLCRIVMEGLGIEDRQRRVFISHNREDGLAVAEQIHNHLSRNGFRPFIDRFHIPPGQDVQSEIANQLEDCAVILLIETPLAHLSKWIFDEVDYALSHQLGLHIVKWPGNVMETPGTSGLQRQEITEPEIVSSKGYKILTRAALDRVTSNIEAEHARSMMRRRRYLLVSTQEAARDAGMECTFLPGWRMIVKDQERSFIVQVTPRLPTADDLCELDEIRGKYPDNPSGILIHATRRIPAKRRSVLYWARGQRDISLIPENAVGGYWRSFLCQLNSAISRQKPRCSIRPSSSGQAYRILIDGPDISMLARLRMPSSRLHVRL